MALAHSCKSLRVILPELSASRSAKTAVNLSALVVCGGNVGASKFGNKHGAATLRTSLEGLFRNGTATPSQTDQPG